MLRDTAHASVSAFRTHLSIESDEPPERIERVIRLAKQLCFAEQLIVAPVPLTSTFTVNGASFHVEDRGSDSESGPIGEEPGAINERSEAT